MNTETKLADFASLRIAREDRANMNTPKLFRGGQLADSLVKTLVKAKENTPLVKLIAARALGRIAVSSVR